MTTPIPNLRYRLTRAGPESRNNSAASNVIEPTLGTDDLATVLLQRLRILLPFRTSRSWRECRRHLYWNLWKQRVRRPAIGSENPPRHLVPKVNGGGLDKLTEDSPRSKGRFRLSERFNGGPCQGFKHV
jgi:hypothetical protein